MLVRIEGGQGKELRRLISAGVPGLPERGATHLKACCVVAGHLADRAWAVLSRGTPYVICDNNGNPVTPAEAAKNIADKWTVSEDIRKRRRSRMIAGKVPQPASTRPDKRGDPPRPRSSRPSGKAVNPAAAAWRAVWAALPNNSVMAAKFTHLTTRDDNAGQRPGRGEPACPSRNHLAQKHGQPRPSPHRARFTLSGTTRLKARQSTRRRRSTRPT